MRVAVHSRVPDPVRAAVLGWLPDSELAASVLDHAVASTEVVGPGGPAGVGVVVEGRRSLSGAPVVVACAGAAEAAVELARTVAPRAAEAGALEVVGPADLGRSLAVAVATRTGGHVETVMDERLMVATEVRTPTGVPGSGRVARVADRPLLAGWFDDFAVEALGAQPRGVEHWVDRLGEVPWEQWLWEVDERVVSLVNSRSTTPLSSRLGPVYTPPSVRGRGYAAALTAHVAQALLDRGEQRVTLLTDETNPTSNALYARVGFTDHGAHGSWLVSVAGDDAGGGHRPSGSGT